MTDSRNDDFRRVYLSENQLAQISRVLGELGKKTGATAVMLGDTTGQLLVKHGGLEERDMEVFGVLAASNLAATGEMAKLIGEKASFEMLLHEGEERSIYLLTIDERYIMDLIFGRGTSPGTVRVYVKRAKERLLDLIASEQNEVNLSAIFDDDFSTMFDEKFDTLSGPDGNGTPDTGTPNG